MRVRLLLFAGLREAAGTAVVDLEVDAPATVADVVAVAAGRHPALRDRTYTTALNQEYAAPETPVGDGDELALIPPVSGG